MTQQKKSCNDYPECGTALLDLSSPALLVFNFIITSNAEAAYATLVTNDYTFNITCGAEIQMITDESREFIFALNQKNNSISFETDHLVQMFYVDIVACPITRFYIYKPAAVGSLPEALTDGKIKMIEPNNTSEKSIEVDVTS